MRVLMYQSGLGPKIPAGEKTSTIRSFTVSKKTGRKGGGAKCKPGDILSHRIWSGRAYASPQIELCQTVCKRISHVRMTWKDNDVQIEVAGDLIDNHLALSILASQEGFEDAAALKAYFKKAARLNIGWFPKPFEGEMIEW